MEKDGKVISCLWSLFSFWTVSQSVEEDVSSLMKHLHPIIPFFLKIFLWSCSQFLPFVFFMFISAFDHHHPEILESVLPKMIMVVIPTSVFLLFSRRPAEKWGSETPSGDEMGFLDQLLFLLLTFSVHHVKRETSDQEDPLILILSPSLLYHIIFLYHEYDVLCNIVFSDFFSFPFHDDHIIVMIWRRRIGGFGEDDEDSFRKRPELMIDELAPSLRVASSDRSSLTFTFFFYSLAFCYTTPMIHDLDPPSPSSPIIQPIIGMIIRIVLIIVNQMIDWLKLSHGCCISHDADHCITASSSSSPPPWLHCISHSVIDMRKAEYQVWWLESKFLNPSGNIFSGHRHHRPNQGEDRLLGQDHRSYRVVIIIVIGFSRPWFPSPFRALLTGDQLKWPSHPPLHRLLPVLLMLHIGSISIQLHLLEPWSAILRLIIWTFDHQRQEGTQQQDSPHRPWQQQLGDVNPFLRHQFWMRDDLPFLPSEQNASWEIITSVIISKVLWNSLDTLSIQDQHSVLGSFDLLTENGIRQLTSCWPKHTEEFLNSLTEFLSLLLFIRMNWLRPLNPASGAALDPADRARVDYPSSWPSPTTILWVILLPTTSYWLNTGHLQRVLPWRLKGYLIQLFPPRFRTDLWVLHLSWVPFRSIHHPSFGEWHDLHTSLRPNGWGQLRLGCWDTLRISMISSWTRRTSLILHHLYSRSHRRHRTDCWINWEVHPFRSGVRSLSCDLFMNQVTSSRIRNTFTRIRLKSSVIPWCVLRFRSRVPYVQSPITRIWTSRRWNTKCSHHLIMLFNLILRLISLDNNNIHLGKHQLPSVDLFSVTHREEDTTRGSLRSGGRGKGSEWCNRINWITRNLNHTFPLLATWISIWTMMISFHSKKSNIMRGWGESSHRHTWNHRQER